MVNKYKRKSTQGSWSEILMENAIREVAELKKNIKSTAAKYGIPRATLQRHLKTGSSKKKLGRFTTVFSEEQELELLNYVFEMDSVFYGLSKEEFLKLVFQYAEKNRISHPFKNGIAGRDWYKGFVARHPDLTLRKPEPTSIARARGFNKPQVYRFFDLLEHQIQKHGIDATRLYNMDETGVQTSSNKPPRVLTKVGKRQVGLIASSERGRNTTVICCCNAAGSFIPPFMIFARKKMNSRLLDGSAPGTQGTCTDNGWINGPAFLEWLRFFIESVRPTSDKKVILVLDNHESHKYLPALELASANHIIFISLAPHTTHRMQPLDYCVYGPLKIYFEQSVATFQKSHAGRIINQNDVASLFSTAYMKAATVQNAIKGFKSTGLFPTDRYIFDESDFEAATVTEKPLILENVPLEVTDPDRTPSPSILDQIIQSKNLTLPQSADILVIDSTLSDKTNINTYIADTGNLTVAETVNIPIVPSNEQSESATTGLALLSNWVQETPITPVKNHHSKIACGKVTTLNLDNIQPSSCLVDCDHFTPSVIRPLPKVAPNKTNRRRKIQKAEILTSTPIKNQQRVKLMKKIKPLDIKCKKLPANNLKNVQKNKKKPRKRPLFQKENSSYPCLVCNELYVDPPKEDWIQCDDCKMWAHEACTSYSGIGSFYCDICQEI